MQQFEFTQNCTVQISISMPFQCYHVVNFIAHDLQITRLQTDNTMIKITIYAIYLYLKHHYYQMLIRFIVKLNWNTFLTATSIQSQNS